MGILIIFALITIVCLSWIFGRGSGYYQEMEIQNKYEYCKMVQIFKDKDMEPIDRFLKLQSILSRIEISNNYESQDQAQGKSAY